MQNGQKEEGLFIESRKGEGVMGKMSCPLPPPRWEIGEGAGARRRRQIRRLWARGWSGVEGKRGREARGADSRPQLGRGGSRAGWPRQRAAVASGRCPRGAAVSKGRGKSITGPRGCPNLPRFGPRGSGEGSPAVAGGGKGERRRCKLGEEGWRWWRWQWGGGTALGALLKASQGGGGSAGRGRRPTGGAAE